ncbi:MAG TPA: PAC2 family protein [Pirellulaceae bacterium]|nr:PAC2 family protein [Pirellulaceae bacterium]
MPEELKLNRPWLVAVWPGMGHVAISAGYYLMAKLGMHVMAEFSPRELFDVEHVEVKRGIIHTGRLPRSRFFVWDDPAGKHDIVVFIGEAQPPLGKYAFCKKLIEFAQQLGVERVFTFAAMATQMHPQHEPRVFGAATSEATLAELKQHELQVQEEGHISGLNGIVLGVAAEAGLSGACLLGEMPHLFSQLPFPAASLAVLKVFTKMAQIDLDLTELAEQAQAMGEKLGEILTTIEHTMQQQMGQEEEDEEEFTLPAEEPRVSPADEERIERLFAQSREDKAKAYELKQFLDKLDVFKEYEDRFLDLFKKS